MPEAEREYPREPQVEKVEKRDIDEQENALSSHGLRKETAKKTEKAPKSDTILTPKKPYRAEDLYKAVEREMEDMMMDMREKFRKKKR
jgi:hypothetical protein